MYKVLNYPVNSVDLADNIHTRNVEKKSADSDRKFVPGFLES